MQSCVPLLSDERVVGAVSNVECRVSCASDPGCYCYAMVDEVCYSGYSECECAAARNRTSCYEAHDDGFVLFKDVVRFLRLLIFFFISCALWLYCLRCLVSGRGWPS